MSERSISGTSSSSGATLNSLLARRHLPASGIMHRRPHYTLSRTVATRTKSDGMAAWPIRTRQDDEVGSGEFGKAMKVRYKWLRRRGICSKEVNDADRSGFAHQRASNSRPSSDPSSTSGHGTDACRSDHERIDGIRRFSFSERVQNLLFCALPSHIQHPSPALYSNHKLRPSWPLLPQTTCQYELLMDNAATLFFKPVIPMSALALVHVHAPARYHLRRLFLKSRLPR